MRSQFTASEGLGYNLVKYIALILLLGLMLFPFLEMISTSLKDRQSIFVYPPPWFPANPAWENYVNVWTYVPLAQYFLNSFIIAIGATLLNAAASIPAGFALARLRFPGRRAFLYLVLITQMFSPVILLIAVFRLMGTLHLLNTYLGLVFMNATVTLPLTVWLLTGYFSTVPREIEEAALLDGAGLFRVLWDHFMPLARPGLSAAFVFTFILSWNEFLLALTLIQDPLRRPLPLGIYGFIGRYQIQWNLLMAASLLAILPVLIMFLLVQRHLVAGLTAGAVK